MPIRLPAIAFLALSSLVSMSAAAPVATYDVRSYGAKGDGVTLDSPAINRAIAAARAAGGGTIYFPAGIYLSGSIHLQSHISLYVEAGAVIEASSLPEAYDPPEPNGFAAFQDFGHSHWHNSLIWGEGLEDISVLGPGVIDGTGLTRGEAPRTGNKAIALKLCRNVTIRDVSILMAGHFGILVTGVDNLTIDNVKIDTNRDGIDIDACRNVRVSNCSVNSPWDDAIVLKSSYALGFARATENVTITNCQVSGWDRGTFHSGKFEQNDPRAPDRGSPTGRIKLGTESNGGFRNIAISNCVFVRSRGLALEAVDGGDMEDVVISNITMRDIGNSPIFLRLGARLRAPAGTPVGAMRRITISSVTVYDADPRFGSIISGITGHPIEDVKLNNIRIVYRGGGTAEQSALIPEENEKDYPEPRMFGDMPVSGFYIRHASGVELTDVEISFMKEDRRPLIAFSDVKGIRILNLNAPRVPNVPMFVLDKVEDFAVRFTRGVPDTYMDRADRKSF
jgi:polygalacturonase